MAEGYEEDVLMRMEPFQDKTIQDLELEIRYLRSLLNSNGIPYDYQAYKESLTTVSDDEIEFPELTREHAIAFYGMFRGRKDVFAQRSAKKGYYTKLTVTTILDHLKGEKEDCTDVVGLYPLFPDAAIAGFAARRKAWQPGGPAASRTGVEKRKQRVC